MPDLSRTDESVDRDGDLAADKRKAGLRTAQPAKGINRREGGDAEIGKV
jgi:hypothetical protein